MHGKLVINPFLELDSLSEEDGDFFLVAPKPLGSLQRLKISKSEQPNLHELFLEFSKTSFDFLSIESDLNQTEREFLHQSGVLVESEKIPQKPLGANSVFHFKSIICPNPKITFRRGLYSSVRPMFQTIKWLNIIRKNFPPVTPARIKIRRFIWRAATD